MGTLDEYLRAHFALADDLAAACRLTTGALETLVHEELVPRPSYTVAEGKLLSPMFGEFAADGAAPGRYFRTAHAGWIRHAAVVRRACDPESALAELEREFLAEYSSALLEFGASIFPTQDRDATSAEAWTAFIAGIFGLCVADAASVRSMALKCVLQEALTALTDNGARADFTDAETRRLHALVEQYDRAVMPFAPPEYPLSSRKRLIDDLRPKLGIVGRPELPR